LRPLHAVLALVAIVALLAFAATAMANTPPPSNGDWVITKGDVTSVSDKTVTIKGNITVNQSSQLHLKHVTLILESTIDGALTIHIEDGSYLLLEDVDIKSSDADVHYWFEIWGKADIRDSDVRDTASNKARYDQWSSIYGGVQIYNSNVTVTRSKFHDSQRINMYVKQASPNITECEFYNSEYVSTHSRYEYVYIIYVIYDYWYHHITDATGLYLEEASPNITRCNFHDNGLKSTAKRYYNTSYRQTLIETLGRGILAHESSPNITDCVFTDNGLNPDDTEISGVLQYFIDGSMQPPPEGGLVCMGAQAHPVVKESGFTGNNHFGIVGIGNGFPDWIFDSQFSRMHHKKQTGPTSYSIFPPSAGIYISDGGGTILLENISASYNEVVANIYVQGPAAIIRNYTNSDNAVQNANNIELGNGNHQIWNSFLDGRPRSSGDDPLLTNLYVNPSGSNAQVRIYDSTLHDAQYGIYIYYNGGDVKMFNSTVRATDTATFFVYTGNIDCVNCTLNPLEVEGYSGTVNIRYFVKIEVTWQNLLPIENAFLQVLNRSLEFIFGGIADENGTLGPMVLTSKSFHITNGRTYENTNSPLYIKGYSGSLESTPGNGQQFVFLTNLLNIRIIIKDNNKPEVHVFQPKDNHAQGSVELNIFGMALDIGSGVDYIDIKLDDSDWELVEGKESWTAQMNLTEGTHQLTVRVHDRAGNEHENLVKNIVIDLTPPELEVLDPVKDLWFSSAENYTLWGRVFGQKKVNGLFINREVVEVGPDGEWRYTKVLESGNNVFTIRAYDGVNNVNEVVKTIVRDSTVPKLILTRPEDGIWTNISQIEVKGITEIGATVRVNGEPVATYSGRFATSIFLTEGENNVMVEAVDLANNVMGVVRLVVLDTIAPVLRIESPQASGIVSGTMLEIQGNIDDPSVENVVINGLLVPVENLQFQKPFHLDEGLNVIVIEAWDKALNYAVRTFRITLDTEPPLLMLLEPEEDLKTQESQLEIKGQVDADAIFTIHWNGELLDSRDIIRLESTFRVKDMALVPGTNAFDFEARDQVGNVARETLVVEWDQQHPTLIVTPLPEETYSEIIEVRGILLDGDRVLINGVPVVLGASGEFRESLHLVKGENTIVAKAFDAAGNEERLVLNVTRTDPPAEPKGVLGASGGISIALMVLMLVIGMLVLYPAYHASRPPKEDVQPEPPVAPPPATSEEAPWEGEDKFEKSSTRPPPPPPPPEEEPGEPVPPWRE
jgi:hypothetical protein